MRSKQMCLPTEPMAWPAGSSTPRPTTAPDLATPNRPPRSPWSPWLASLATVCTGLAADSHPGVETLEKVIVAGENIADDAVQPLFPPEVQDVRIFSGKKAVVLDLDALPQIQTDNYRQAFAKVPGLLTSELSNPSLLSLSYRGIGDPRTNLRTCWS